MTDDKLRALREWITPRADDARSDGDDPFGFIEAESWIAALAASAPDEEPPMVADGRAARDLLRQEIAATHPHDGYAYDGCVCTCCRNVRLLQTDTLARPAVPALDVERLRAAIRDHSHEGLPSPGVLSCDRGHVEVHADAIAREYAALQEQPE